MAKAHCDKHKRYVPSCPACQSAALRETVGFPKTEAESEETNDTGVVGGGGSSESVAENDSDEEGGDIAEWEPEVVEEEPAPLPSYKPKDIDETEEAMTAEGEFDPASHPVTPGEGEPDIPDGTLNLAQQMSPIDMAMMLFPRRLIPEGATEVCDEERPDEPYMASYEELVRRALAGYLELGLTPEDAVIVVSAEVIHADQLDFEEDDGPNVVDKEGFDAGLEAAPELTGCIEDYNQGFNDGMSALHRLMIGYYSGDEDAVAYATMRWVEQQMEGMKK